ncbi:MAG: putative N-acetyltransferase YhbS, partial [Polaribacter sp.]
MKYTYSIEEVYLENDDTNTKVNNLLNEVFGGISINKVRSNTTSQNKNKSLYLAAIENNEIIGFNAFIPHTVLINNELIDCYQSCWTATSKKHRKKQIFQNLIKEGKKILKSRNAGFIIGFANRNSFPIFVKKLGFKAFNYELIRIPNIGFIKNSLFNHKNIPISTLNKNAVLQKNDELIKLREVEYPERIIKINNSNGFIWGTIKKKAYKGIALSFFDLGGIEVENSDDVMPLISKLCKEYSFNYILITTIINNSYNSIYKEQ